MTAVSHVPIGPRLAALLLAAVVAGCGKAPAIDAPYRTVEGGRPARGLVLVGQYQCGSCHVLPGAVEPSLRIGPSLNGFGRRSYIAGVAPNGPANLQRWLQSPQALVPGATMPDLGVSADDARDIAAYLMSLS